MRTHTQGRRSRLASGLLWLAAVALSGLALLNVVPPPHYLLWQLSIPVQEWGYWLLPLTIVLAALAFRRGSGSTAAGIPIALSGAVFLVPLAQAARLVGQLPDSTGALLSPAVLLTGSDLPASPPERLVFVQHEGGPLALDYYAATEDHAPLVVVIHGGGWRAGAADELASLNYWLAERGYAVAAISYRFAPEHPFPAAVDDVRTAIEWLKERSHDLGIDSSRIALLGRSAGGHLALLAAYSFTDPAVRGVVSFYGPTNLVWAWGHPSPEPVYDSRGTLADFTGGTPGDRPDVYAAASPVSFVGAAVPTLLVHGARDPLVSVEHSRMLTDSLRAHGAPVTFIEMPWATHGCDFAFNGPCGQISATAVARFLENVLRRPGVRLGHTAS